MWSSSHGQFPSSSALQPLEGALQSIGPTTSSRLDPNPPTRQLETLNGEQSGQRLIRRVSRRFLVQRRMRWKTYSVTNILREQQSEDTNSSGQGQNTTFTSCNKRLKKVQSSPEFGEDMPSRKKHRNNSMPLPEDSPSRISSFGLPITKSRSEEEVSGLHSPLGDTCEANINPLSMDSNILSGFRGMRRSSFSPYARVVAIRLIKHAREHKVLDEWMVWCRNCDRIPVNPVTGPCGHTRCKRCIERNGACPCGVQAPGELFVDVVTRHLIDKMFQDCSASEMKSSRTTNGYVSNNYGDAASASAATRLSSSLGAKSFIPAQIPRALATAKAKKLALSPRVPMTPQVRFKYARGLISAGQLKKAVVHLARAATYEDPIAHSARTLLIRTLNSLLQGSEPRSLSRQLNRLVRSHATSTWLSAADLECPLCLLPYAQPVTTPCGHTFCRSCIERLIDYKKPCALCKRPLYDFDLSMTEETLFVSAALEAINEVKPLQSLDNDFVYIVVCTVTFPTIPCPLFILQPRYWSVIRRVLNSEARTFGMVACDRDGINYNYGMLLEVRDCVLMENGSFLLSTIGVSRFRVVATDVWDGCDVARIETVADIIPSDRLTIMKLKDIAAFTRMVSVFWLSNFGPALREAAEGAFGALPEYSVEPFWETPDGPAWLWWFIAILPLKLEIKVLILSTKCVLKRLMAVIRIIDTMKSLPNAGLSVDCQYYNDLDDMEAVGTSDN